MVINGYNTIWNMVHQLFESITLIASMGNSTNGTMISFLTSSIKRIHENLKLFNKEAFYLTAKHQLVLFSREGQTKTEKSSQVTTNRQILDIRSIPGCKLEVMGCIDMKSSAWMRTKEKSWMQSIVD